MWWGDDGTLSGAVAKGSAALDPLFLEAEKHGMDIRLQRKTPAFTLGLLGSGDGAASETPAEADKQMVFSFFGAEDSAMDVVDVPVNPFLTNTSAKAMVGAEVREEVSLVPVVPAAGAKASTVTLTAPENAATAPGAKVKTVEVVFTAAQLVSMAKMFARER